MPDLIDGASSPACACGRPRACGGRLSRCLQCLRADVDRDSRERAARRHSEKPRRQFRSPLRTMRRHQK
jgi:hypothetical protein